MSLDAPDVVTPALAGASIAGVVPALLGARSDEWLPPSARAAEQVVLLVLDGLGWSAIQSHTDQMPTLAAMEGGPITTVVPSTTATALTSIATGLAPAQHGIVGYRMVVGGDVLNVLRWTVPGGGRGPDPFDVQRHTAFLGRAVPAITRSEFRTTGFTQAHLRGARFVGWHTLAVLVEQCARAVDAGERLVYAYYPGVDTVAHEFGLHDRVYRRELADTDRLVATLLDALPSSAALLVTSDHGQMHLERESWIELPGVVARSERMAGDGRFRYCYAARGSNKELLAAARDEVGERGLVLTRGELLDAGFLGEGATGTIPGRIGDVIIAARGAYAFVDPALSHERELRSGHGSLSPDEMLVPLLAAPGRAG
jgi:predicted AlkP superfamily pyrophosphatase or phosphodiesterase